jgi:glycosyltransferase involved in cell wall biosynthesis
MASRLRELGVTVRIETVPTGIDIALFAAGRRRDDVRERNGVRKGDRMLFCVGRLAKEKSLELLFEALARANDPSLKLVIAGDGPSRADLEQLAREFGVFEQSRFLGFVSRQDLPDLYASADAFVMASTTETQGIVQVEALAAGASVIAADAPQNRDVLGSAGLLVPSTAQAFAQAFGRVGNVPDPARAAVAREAAKRFSIEEQIDRTLALYESLVRPARIA